MVIETRVYPNGRIEVPEEYVEKFDIKPNDIAEWDENEDGEIVLSFRKKLSPSDLEAKGHVNEKTNAVDLGNSLYY